MNHRHISGLLSVQVQFSQEVHISTDNEPVRWFGTATYQGIE
jgi:hypothetical protein